jgi:hypothetical protein
MLAAVIEGPGAVVVRDTAPPRAAGLALVRGTQAGARGAASERPEQLKIVLDVAGP